MVLVPFNQCKVINFSLILLGNRRVGKNNNAIVVNYKLNL